MFKKEYLLAFLISIFVLIFSNMYVLYGIIEPKADLFFLSRRVINSQDMYTYVSFIEQSRQGKILFENLYTTESQNVTLFRPSYTVLGGLAYVLNISSVAAYHIGRIIFSVLFFAVLYIFIKQFFQTPKKRLFAFSVILLSTGVGFLLDKLISDSSDLWIPESVTFLSLQEAPHFILAQILMLLSFMFLLKGWESARPKYFLVSFLSLFFLGFEHPYNLFIVLLTVIFMSSYMFFSKRVTGKTLWLGFLAVIAGVFMGNLYQLIEVLRNPILRSWAFPSPSPIPASFLAGYGLIMVFALFGLENFLKEKKMPQVLILSWFCATAVLLYAPVYFQRRLSEGLHIPISILAVVGILIVSIFLSKFVLEKVRKYVLYVSSCLFAILLMVGTVTGVNHDIVTISHDSTSDYYYYILTQEAEGMKYLRKHATSKDVVLSNWFYGNIIPGIAGRKVYVGHKAQTKDFDKKVALINKFILNDNTREAYTFLKQNNVRYIFVGKNDSMLKYGFKPDSKPYLIKVFDFGESAGVYEVKD